MKRKKNDHNVFCFRSYGCECEVGHNTIMIMYHKSRLTPLMLIVINLR